MNIIWIELYWILNSGWTYLFILFIFLLFTKIKLLSNASYISVYFNIHNSDRIKYLAYICNSYEFEERRNECELNKISISNFIQQTWSLKDSTSKNWKINAKMDIIVLGNNDIVWKMLLYLL